MGHLACFTPHLLCAVCGDHKKLGDTWFVITENYWEDRLKVWKWNEGLARNRAARSVCGQRHARELVVHWMTTGCLHYPFASMPLRPREDEEPHAFVSCEGNEPESSRAQLGELAVDREGMARVLNENPISLNAVLDELMIALENEAPDDPDSEHEERMSLALRTV